MTGAIQPDDKVNPLRVLVDLQRSPETMRQEAPQSGLEPHMALLRAWQSERLKRTYADFLADDRTAQACQFFLSDVYAPQDFSQRDHDLETLYGLLSRFIPAPMLSLVAAAIELNQLSNNLDTRLIDALVNELGMLDAITPALYSAGYRLCDNYAERVHQIDLMSRILQEVGEGAGQPLVAITLKAARLPAKRFGWQDLHDFLVRGHAAFRRLGRHNELASTIRQREMQILDRIFAGEEEPF
jgi:hypothetical protein